MKMYLQGVQLKSGTYFNMSNLFTKIYNMLHYTTRGVQRVLVGKPEGKRPLGRPRRRREDNIKMDLQEVGSGSWGLDGVGSG